jgi:uncharacterized LabA/DUF88 family protein
MIKKAIIFVDANNWYHNLKYSCRPGEIDICKVSKLIKEKRDLEILEIRWYTSMPDIKDNPLVYKKQRAFLGSLQKKGIKVITRKLQKLSNKELKKKRQDFIESWDLCEVCKPIVEASFLDMPDNFQKEKGIDVWIAIDMVKEAIKENIDVAVLISGDADFVPAFSLIKDIGKNVLSCSVPRGYSNELRQKFPYFILTREELTKCLKDYGKGGGGLGDE